MNLRFPARAALGLCLLAAAPAWAGGGPFGIDHKVTYDDSGIWDRNIQKGLAAGVALTTIGGALFANNDSRMGRVWDQALDSMVLTAGTTTVMKYAFSRARPSETDDPNDWFQGSGHTSFPSGEVAEMAAVVTPFIAEYHHDHPMVWALTLLPTYDAIARVKVQGHWQSDVLAGAAVGIAWGVWAHRRPTPLIMGIMPGGGVMVGYSKQF
jgi:membrane-associated phospholipid phosphatase